MCDARCKNRGYSPGRSLVPGPRFDSHPDSHANGQRRTETDEESNARALFQFVVDAHGQLRTPVRQFRKPLLYPLSYEATAQRLRVAGT